LRFFRLFSIYSAKLGGIAKLSGSSSGEGSVTGLAGRLRALSARQKLLAAAGLLLVIGAAVVAWSERHGKVQANTEVSSQSRRAGTLYRPTEAEWANLTVEPVELRSFRSDQVTEGKISIDEDRSTPIFSPYSGRVLKLLAKPGEAIQRGQPLFIVEATDTVQALSDFMSAVTGLNKARSALTLAQITEKRQHDLYDGKAAPLREWQQAQADLVAAQNDVRSAEITLEASRNRLRILGRTDQEISTFQEQGRVNPETPVFAPISGTIVQRRVGPGQYVSAGSSDPVFVIGDLSTVWLTAYVRETEASKVSVGEDVSFVVLAYPDRVFSTKLNYVAAALDPASRRLMVRATVDNPGELLKPEMFATVTIYTDQASRSVAVPRDALIYEGSNVRVWVALDDKSIELRRIKTGLTNGRMIQVVSGLSPGDRVITKGSLFIDRVAAGS
jgi:membrane fusion protein, heavy metal efflux system